MMQSFPSNLVKCQEKSSLYPALKFYVVQPECQVRYIMPEKYADISCMSLYLGPRKENHL